MFTFTLLIFTCGVIRVHTEGYGVFKDFSARNKRQVAEDRWSWGYVDVTEHPHKEPYISSSPPPSYPDVRACDRYNPPVPNFLAPGKRISEAKCEEYIWHMKIRDEKQKKAVECDEYYKRNRDPNEPPPLSAVGGHSTLIGEYPHMGAVGWKAAGGGTWIFKCGSSLISAKFLLTAGHCSRASPRDETVADITPKIVRLGDKNIADVYYNQQFPNDKEISRIIVHPQYAPPKKYNDIAIIELVEEVLEFTELVQPACLWTKFDTSSLGLEATLTGWGVVDTTNLQSSPELQAAEVDIIDSKVCDNLLRSFCSRLWCGMQDGQICAGKLTGGVDACQGDSGGPLQVRIPLAIQDQGAMHYVIGVTSFGIGCARASKPGIYTRVSTYIDWIESVVWPFSKPFRVY
ncbi:tryptase beta-2-like [Choristoneura fumiferana]|uniref:tryptase beta-2-like n=1 Tax=Choristoneura fumiferana TaxID=7141 RepID=UPI003D15D108